MTRIFVAALGVAVLVAPATSFAAEGDSGYFATIHGGISSNRISLSEQDVGATDRNDSAYSIRGGYRWGNTLNYGVEIGYVDLGHSAAVAADDALTGALDAKAQGLTVGGNLQYDFGGSNWFVGLHGGWFRARNELTASLDGETGRLKYSNEGGWYAGASAGYKVSENLRVGLAFDNYRNKLEVREAGLDRKFHTEMYSGFFEYKF